MSHKRYFDLFSIIIPVFNRESMVIDALDSVKAQTYRPIEIIVVDDGSTDDTAGAVKHWAAANGEPGTLTLKYIYQENAGPGAARNRGISEISGDFVQYLDSDDRLHPERLAILADTFHGTGADFILTGFERIDEDTGEVLVRKYGWSDRNQQELALEGLLWANTLRAAFTAALVADVGPWDASMTCFEDREYVERAVMLATKPIALRTILATANGGGSDNLSRRLRSHEGRTFRILCEERLANNVRNRGDIRLKAKQAFASRLYALGFRSAASGWPDHHQRCGEIAASLGVELDTKGKLRRLVWKSGRIGALVYIALSKLKTALPSARS